MTRRHLPGLLALALVVPGCSIKKLAINSLGNALAEGGSTYAEDDDPDLVGQAVPFGLKTIEALLSEAPRHEGLLQAATSGFTQYAYGWVQMEADFAESDDLARATYLRQRALRLYLRALGYGFRGLELDMPGLREALRKDPATPLLQRAKKKHVPLLYWTALAWGAAISLAKNDAELSADQNRAEALARRALELDEGFELGSIHDFFISYEGGRSSVGGSLDEARRHLVRARQLSHDARVAPLVAFAETVSVANQDKPEFERLLKQALEADPDRERSQRLANRLYQRRARWLLDREDELFVD